MNADERGPNNYAFLRHVLERLQQHGFASLVFGGWAEELLQLVPPRSHRDVDLLLPADSFVAFDRFLASAESHGWREIVAKRFAHKRAFLAQGVMVELTLVGSGLVTNFWGDVAFHWLDPLAHGRPIEIDGFTAPLVSAANLLRFRQLHRKTEPWRWREQPAQAAVKAPKTSVQADGQAASRPRSSRHRAFHGDRRSNGQSQPRQFQPCRHNQRPGGV